MVTQTEEDRLLRYIEQIALDYGCFAHDRRRQRVECCQSSRSLYCPECCQVKIPRQEWPTTIQDGTLKLPFSLDIILGVKERRASSTGIQIKTIANMMIAMTDERRHGVSDDGLLSSRCSFRTAEDVGSDEQSGCRSPSWWQQTHLYDLNRDSIPEYGTNPHGDEVSTFVLFPLKGRSVPLSAVAHKIKRLVVLDCKWSASGSVKGLSLSCHKTSRSRCLSLQRLPFVHLSHPPKHSLFWRWHHLGDGMLSTIEAVYFAALEVDATCESSSNEQRRTNKAEVRTDREQMIDLMWLFALQRSVIQQRHLKTQEPKVQCLKSLVDKESNNTDSIPDPAPRPMPYSPEGKLLQQSIRRRKDGRDARAHLRRSKQETFYST